MTDQPATGAPASADTPLSSSEPDVRVTGTEPEVVAPTAEETAAADAAKAATDAEAAKAVEDAKVAERAPEQLQKAFNKIAFEKREAERRMRELEEQVAELRKLQAAPKPNGDKPAGEPETMTRAEAQAWAQEEAKKLSAAQTAEANARQQADAFNKAANTVYETGTKEFSDFEATISNLRNMGHMTYDTVDTALATDNPQRVLYELGKNLDEAERIMALTPAKRAVEFAKLAAKAPAAPPKKEVSAAPPPVPPLEGSIGISDDLRDDEDMATWGKKYEKRMAARQR